MAQRLHDDEIAAAETIGLLLRRLSEERERVAMLTQGIRDVLSDGERIDRARLRLLVAAIDGQRRPVAVTGQ